MCSNLKVKDGFLLHWNTCDQMSAVSLHTSTGLVGLTQGLFPLRLLSSPGFGKEMRGTEKGWCLMQVCCLDLWFMPLSRCSIFYAEIFYWFKGKSCEIICFPKFNFSNANKLCTFWDMHSITESLSEPLAYVNWSNSSQWIEVYIFAYVHLYMTLGLKERVDLLCWKDIQWKWMWLFWHQD